MMERQYAKFFINLVKELISDDGDKEKLFESLRRYQSNQDLRRLLQDLRTLLNEPTKLELYEFMRPLILMRHQIEYSQSVPSSPGVKLRTVRLQRHVGESLGFAVRGGYEHGVGVFITDVSPGSQAHRQGLRIGDEIVRVNGFTISEAIHDDVLDLIKSRDEITLKVTYIGMLPVKNEPTDDVDWQYVKPLETFGSSTTDRQRSHPQDIKIYIDSTGHASIGCSIVSERNAPSRHPGIFVEKVRPGSIGEEVGIEPGDQIMEVNDTSFRNITWKEAVLALKSSRQLNMVIRKQEDSRFLEQLTAAPISSSAIPVESEIPRRPDGHEVPSANQNVEPVVESPAPANDIAPPSGQVMRESSWHYERADNFQLSHQKQDTRCPSPQWSFGPSSSLAGSATSPTSSLVSTSAEVHPRSSRGSVTSGQLAGSYEWSDHVAHRLYRMFDADYLNGRPLKRLTFNKSADLGIDIEGGMESPLGDKVLVGMVFDGGVASFSGKLHVGDQLMAINEKPLTNMTVSGVEQLLQEAGSDQSQDVVEILYCESTWINDEDSVTYF